ncbi:MAG: lipoprotein-releasing ABC transporter permease subunit [Pseudomonadota bacterium]
MLAHFERIIAFRYLRARREEGFISIIAMFSLVGIALGVATLIVVLAVMNGVRGEMINSIIGLEGHVTVYSNERGIADYEKISADLAGISGVKLVLPKVDGQIMASHDGIATGAMVAGFRQQDIEKKPLLLKKIAQDELASFKRGEGIIIGKRMVEKLRLKIGDDLLLISPEGRATIAGLVPRVKAYPVVGTFEIGMFAYDNSLILMPFSEAQTYFKLKENGGDNASVIEITADNPDKALDIARQVSQRLGSGYHVYDWKSSNNHIFEAVLVQRNVMFLILMLIILVASFNIISSLIMLVREKGQDIAILRTMGASQGSVMRIFFMCGASVGVVGTFIGFLLGLLIAFNTENIQAWLESMIGQKIFSAELYFLSHLPSKVDFKEVVMVLGFSLALSFLATIYPARRAAKLNPAEALRYE